MSSKLIDSSCSFLIMWKQYYQNIEKYKYYVEAIYIKILNNINKNIEENKKNKN